MAFPSINFNSIKQKLRSSSENFSIRPFEILAISGLVLFFLYAFFLDRFIGSASMLFSPWQVRWVSTERNPKNIEYPTNISHIVFGIITAERTWKPRKPYVEAWWRPNVTRGYLFLDKPPTQEFIPWPQTSPPYRISDDTSKLERESKHVAPIMIRMVHSIIETFREGENGTRWFVIGFDDSVFFVDNWVDVLAKYDHTKYIFIGTPSETLVSNLHFSFEMGFGGGGIALSYPLAKAMVKELDACIKRYPYVNSADLITQFCVDEFGVPLTVERGIHQIDLRGDISGFLSSHPQALLLSLHHLDFVEPIIPKKDRFESIKHLMKAADYDQSRLLQQTICYHRPQNISNHLNSNQLNWSFSISWGYSIHIYEKIIPRHLLKRPLETFLPWLRARPPMFMFNTRWPCENIPNILFFDRIYRERNEIVSTYIRPSPIWYPWCPPIGNRSVDFINEVRIFSSIERRKEIERSECCEIKRLDSINVAEVKLRACKDDEIIA